MSKIATWGEINGRIGSSGSPANKCPTKAEILATGRAVVGGIYADSQLVQLEHIGIAAIYTVTMHNERPSEGDIWASGYDFYPGELCTIEARANRDGGSIVVRAVSWIINGKYIYKNPYTFQVNSDVLVTVQWGIY